MNPPHFDAVPVEEYLNATYQPDCEYDNGQLIQRARLGAREGAVKARLLAYFREIEDAVNARALEDQRIRIVEGKRYRLADLCLVRRPHASARVLVRSPLVVIEIPRPGERPGLTLSRLSDFFQTGVPHLWAVDPAGRRIFAVSRYGIHDVTETRMAIPELSLTLNLIPFLYGEGGR
jgi:Uma2 family endonuclease